MPIFHPIIFVHGWGGVSDLARDFNDADERDPYAGWNQGRRYNDPDGWVKFRDTQPNFEGLVLRLVKEFNYYDASNDEELAEFKQFLGQSSPAAGESPSPPGPKSVALTKSLWIFRYYEYNAEHLRLDKEVEAKLAAELTARGYPGTYAGVPRYAALLAVKIQQIACPKCNSLKDWSEVDGLDLKRVALVGHSMGGLIARFAIQYNLFDIAENVTRLMTLSTPHGGARHAAPVRLLSWLPGMRNDDITFLTPEWVKKEMGGQEPQPQLGQLAPTDVFCLIGTRHEGYYPIARHLPRTDGIVHQEEAFLKGYPYAFVYNTHSGEYGIRENHDAYQALRRFLFGDLHVRISITNIALRRGVSYPEGTEFFFHYFVKPRGINAHLNELSERAENQPKPRTLTELKEKLRTDPYIIFDGFADSGALVGKEARAVPGVVEEEKELPHFQLEYNSFMFDPWVGAKSIGGGFVMLPLAEGEREIIMKDQAFQATLLLKVTKRL